MLNKVTGNVLKAINYQCRDTDGFIITKNSDIVALLDRRTKVTNEAISKVIRYLADHEFIKLKYSQEGTYCLAMLPKGRHINENTKVQKVILNQQAQYSVKFFYKIAFISAIFSFFGAATAILMFK